MTRSLTVANVEEYYAPATRVLAPPFRRAWARAADKVAGGAIFWDEAPGVLVLPKAAKGVILREVCDRMGAQVPEVFSPPHTDATLCQNLTAHPALLDRLVESLARLEVDRVVTWGETPQLHELVLTLEDRGIRLDRDCCPRAQGWKVDYLDSKAGFRDLCSGLRGTGAPIDKGWLAGTLAEAGRLAQHLLSSGHGAVVKADRGVAGAGNVCFPAGSRLKSSAANHLRVAARTRPELLAGPLTVERLLAPPQGLPASASAQCSANAGGGSVLFLAAHTVDGEGANTGASIGISALDPALCAKVEDAARAICLRASDLGYRGVMGIDFAIGADGEPRPVEINARRTTASSAAGLARRVNGERWAEKCHVLLLENVNPPPGDLWRELPREPGRLLFPIASSTEGWLPIPALCAKSDDTLWSGAIVLSGSPERARAIAAQLRASLG